MPKRCIKSSWLKEEIQLKMTSVIAITPKEGSADDVKQLIVDSRADGGVL